MGRTLIPANNRGLISTFGNYPNRTSTSYSGVFGVSTYPLQTPGSSLVAQYGSRMGYYPSGYYCYYQNIASSNATKGYVAIIYPWYETSSGTSLIGNNKQVVTYTHTFLSIIATTNYGYTFKGWYTLPSGGTLIDSNYSTTMYHDGAYNNTVWYAQWY